MKFTRKISRGTTVTIIMIVAGLLLTILPGILGMYDNMIGKDGLKNTIVSCIFRIILQWIVLIGFVLTTICMYRSIKTIKGTIIADIVFFVIPVAFFLYSMGTHYEEIHGVREDLPVIGTYSLIFDCIVDNYSDEYECYIVDNFEIISEKHNHISGSRFSNNTSYISEQLIYGIYKGEKVFVSQVGSNDVNELIKSIPTGYDITVTVYKESGLIRSIEPSVSFSSEEKYEHIYEITKVENRLVRYTGPNGNFKLKNPCWCLFEQGVECIKENSLCQIGVTSENEFYSWLEKGQVCIFGWINGQYRRISNIIYITDDNVIYDNLSDENSVTESTN